MPVWVLSRPPSVPFAEFQKDRRHRANHQPDVFGFIAEMDDVTIMVLFFDRYPIIQAFVDKSRCLHCVKRAGLRRAGEYSCDHSGIRNRLDQVLKICLLDYEATGPTVGHCPLLKSACCTTGPLYCKQTTQQQTTQPGPLGSVTNPVVGVTTRLMKSGQIAH